MFVILAILGSLVKINQAAWAGQQAIIERCLMLKLAVRYVKTIALPFSVFPRLHKG